MVTERLGFELKEFNAALLTGLYQTMGTPLENPAVYATIINASDTDVYISINGVDNHIRVPAGKTQPIPPYDRHNDRNDSRCVFAEKTQLYIKHNIAPGIGYIAVNICT